MRKKVFLVLGVFFLFPVVCFAAAIGGTETVGKGEWSIGLEQEVVFERNMENASLSGGQRVELEIDKAYRTMAKISYGLMDNMDMYIKLGTSEFEVDQKVFSPDESGEKDSKTDFAYGAGLKWNMPLKKGCFLGVDAQYLRHRNKYTYTNTSTAVYDVQEDKLTLQQWHVASYIGKKMGKFVPYLGVRYSDARLKSEGQSTWVAPCNWKSEAEDNVGIFVGTDVKLADNWTLNVEGRFIDETAMSVGSSFKF